MIVKGNEVMMTNREYFATHCLKTDLCRISRMWDRHLDKTIGRDAPMPEKEVEYDKWMHAIFDYNEWDAARTKTNNEYWW